MKNAIHSALRALRENRSLQLLLLVVVTGAALRFYGLRNAENTDEYNEVFEALRVASGKFNFNRWHKKGFQNLLAVEYGLYFAIGYVLKLYSNPMDFAAKIVANLDPLLLIGRYTTAALGTLSIALVAVIGRRLYNDRVALLAALFFALNSLHVWTSHLVNTDVPLTFFFLLSLYFICGFHGSGRIRDYVAAAFFGAVAINIKLTGIGIGLLFLAAHFSRCREQERGVAASLFCRETGYSSVAFLAGLVLSNPPLVLGLKKFIEYHYGVYTNVYDEVPYAVAGNAYATYAALLYREFGAPLFLAALGGLAYGIIRRQSWDIIFLLFVAALYLALSNTTFLVQDRYLMTMFPVLFLMTARFLDRVAWSLPWSAVRQTAGLVAVCGVLLYHPAANSLRYVRSLTDENTSLASKKWIEANIPDGSKLLVDAGRTIITSGPRLNPCRRNLEEKLGVIKNLKEGQTYDSPLVRIVDSYSSIYFELLLKNVPKTAYDITTTELGKSVQLPEYYRQQGYDYFIHDRELQFRIDDPLWRNKYPVSARFYDTFASQFALVKTFSSTATSSGSTIMVFRIR